jgi:diguanylate cyclase (GGDEF)-like protein/PAS domain S-box-containing protein
LLYGNALIAIRHTGGWILTIQGIIQGGLPMAWAIPTVITAMLSTLVLTILYYYLYIQYRERYIGMWTISLFTQSLGPVLLMLVGVPERFLVTGEQLSALLYVMYLVWGIKVYIGKPISWWWTAALYFGMIWLVAGSIFNFPFFIHVLPVLPTISFGLIWAGWIFLRNPNLGGIGKITGWGLVLSGIHRGDYLFFRSAAWFIPWGFVVVLVLTLLTAVGMLLIYFQNIRKDLSESHAALRESEERYRFMAENARDIIYRIRLTPVFQVEYMSPAVMAILGYTPEEHYFEPGLFFQIVHPDYRQILENMFAGNFDFTNTVAIPWYRKDGKLVWTEQYVVPFYDEKGKIEVLEGIGRDVTERILIEEKLKYLSLRDSLTGLYNRAFFEQACRQFESEENNPLGLILYDIDGLKLINDSMGHESGDTQLLAAAQAIKDSFRDTDVIARIGGDEFAVLLPNCKEEILRNAVQRTRNWIVKYNEANREIHLSVSVGHAIRNQSTISLNDLFREADNSMYREKLYRSQSARSAIILTLMKALEERDFITEGHAVRLQDLVVRLASNIGLSEHYQTELRLLAQFHDIGKVGIPDRILFKQGSLTPEEALEMQRHCEVGYRIAQSAPDLVPIAEWILKHHEWWNGQGYPLGLKGEEIPLECRILSIADAYDAMTNDRPYRKAIPHDQALLELLRCAGTQFDPRLVNKFVLILDQTDEPSFM